MGSRRNRLAVAVLAGAALSGCGAAASSHSVSVSAAPSGTPVRGCPARVRHLGLIAFTARGGRLELVDLARCRVSVLRASGAADPRFSPDGRWLAFGATFPTVMPARGGVARTPLGTRLVVWTWAPRGALLYGITAGGSLVAAAPSRRHRVVAANLTGSYLLRLSPDGGRIAIDRSRCRPPALGELDVVDVRTGARTAALRRSGHFLRLEGWSPDGRWLLFWDASQCSSSLAADGWPLEAVPATGGSPATVVPHMLLYDDFLSWCGSRLVAAAGPDRETQTGSALDQAAAPAWRTRTLRPGRQLSWVSPSCAAGGREVAAAAGPGNAPTRFGLEHRSIWLLRAGGGVIRRLTVPPARDLSDEAPRFSRDGRWIMFVRSRVLPVDRSHDTIELVRANGAGNPVPIIDFSSDDFSYYDHFLWPYEIAWSASLGAFG